MNNQSSNPHFYQSLWFSIVMFYVLLTIVPALVPLMMGEEIKWSFDFPHIIINLIISVVAGYMLQKVPMPKDK